PDDWAATPMTLAIIARRGLQGKLVHYSYNNSLGSNDAHMYQQQTYATLGAADRFGFNRAKFFDCQKNLSGGIANLRNQINVSTASNPLYIIAAGPMEFLWRTINGSNASRRQYVTIISHSPWNNTWTI